MPLDWESRYIDALGKAAESIRPVRGIIVAYNTNIDGLKTVNGRWLSQLLAEDADLKERVAEKFRETPGEVTDLSDLVAALLYYMREGAGGERLILAEDVFQWLSRAFGPGELRMGGQAGIMANVLSSLGVRLVAPHVAQLPREQAELFDDQERTRIPTVGPLGTVFARPVDAARENDKKLIHWVLNFKEGATVSFNNITITAPRENRFIATYDEDNAELRISSSFVEGVTARIAEFDGAIISGFHLLRRSYRDGSSFEAKLERALRPLREWRELNPKLRLHLELGSMQAPEVEAATLRASGLFHSVGMNEDELKSGLAALALRPVSETRNREPSAEAVYRDALALRSELKVERLNVHTRDFSMSVLSGRYAERAERELDGLLVGAAVAAARAATGRFPPPEQILRLQRDGVIPPSPRGLRQHQALVDAVRGEDPAAALSLSEQGFAKLDGLSLVYAPSRWVERTVSTVGLGDAISSASFAMNLL
ncbi:MAG: ADP-dependent glucokinase/phosphofructokinase [Candidatus Bathyarchaeia archaeon]